MKQQNYYYSFEIHLKSLFKVVLTNFVKSIYADSIYKPKRYLNIKEISSMTGIGTYTIRQLTYSRAMPHRKVFSRLIFDENEIKETVENFKRVGWNDPENDWNVKKVQADIDKLNQTKAEPLMIDDILRKIIREELASFSNEIKNYAKKDKESYYGRTVLTIKEAANHFRTSPNTIYSLIKDEGMPHFKIQSRFYIVLEEAEAYLWRETAKSYADEGNIYWQRILQRLDWEEKERNAAYEKALKRLEESTY
ncbi:helix-turn-helix domain-containing protein [Cytobacillus massiliigabonensis]|uniref:helix-turn-helix domain-containing protein n=1 Tax=Cytobacillus massiliigabonensis TaxID=1871011 RepID=UPI000C83361A|nr:helix-turn-helix domain-containing protein [Cytobacillus massiliigabonensis]